MQSAEHLQELGWRIDPIELLQHWPERLPLACLVSALGGNARSRWSVFASPSGAVRHARGRTEWIPYRSGAALAHQLCHDPLADLAMFLKTDDRPRAESAPLPFATGWLGWLAYELGFEIEPAARGANSGVIAERDWPLFELFRCDAAIVHDAESGEWHVSGETDQRAWLIDSVASNSGDADAHRFEAGPLRSGTGRRAFEDGVERVIEYTRAGDIFQANLSHRLSATFEGSARAFAARLLADAGPWYGAYMESFAEDGSLRRAICSASPELFLSFDAATRRVVTRPIKGTRRDAAGAHEALLRSDKDSAELTMIVDLMRNDLGRVCEYGSVRVQDPRSLELHGVAPRRRGERGDEEGLDRIETRNSSSGPASLHQHNSFLRDLRVSVVNSPGIWQGVATVSGVLREGLGSMELLRATFPPGSVTGAPKIRAMQVIDELEPVQRGPYCGAIGFFNDRGDAALSVAIRTAAITCEPGSTPASARGVLEYSVGAGIVAESDPAREWQETLDKAAVLRAALEQNVPMSPVSRDREEAGRARATTP